MSHDITVVIPTIPERAGQMLSRARMSAEEQTLEPAEIIVELAGPGEGPAVVRNRAVSKVKTNWIAFLDDDDYLLPRHLETLATVQEEFGADIVWPWFRVEGGGDPFPMHRGRQWDPNDPHIFPITTLVRTSAFITVGGFDETAGDRDTVYVNGEDFRLWLALSNSGFWFRHTPEITWVWCHHGRNTSGMPSRRH